MPTIEILIADDHGSFRRNLRLLLESRSDWRVCGEAADGELAVEKAKQLRPHVVLMDLSMPKMDGGRATRLIRQKVPESKVIIVSQNDPEVLRQQARELGAVAWVAKCNLATDLIPTIQQAITKEANTL